MRVYRATNIHASPLKFEIDPQELLQLSNAIEDDGQELGAIYHSHMRSEPYPSQTDINFAANWPGVEWIIVGLADGEEPEVRSYRDRRRGEIKEVAAGGDGAGERASRSSARAALARIPARERFCAACGMPLVYRRPGPSAKPPSASARRARSSPSTPKGELVKVARAQNQPEAEFIEGLLLEEGIPCMLRRSSGFDVRGIPRGRHARRAGARVRRRGGARSARAAAASTAARRRARSALGEDGLAGARASLVIARISSEARSNSASESTGVPSKGSSRCSSTQAWEAVYSSLTLTVTGRGMR